MSPSLRHVWQNTTCIHCRASLVAPPPAPAREGEGETKVLHEWMENYLRCRLVTSLDGIRAEYLRYPDDWRELVESVAFREFARTVDALAEARKELSRQDAEINRLHDKRTRLSRDLESAMAERDEARRERDLAQVQRDNAERNHVMVRNMLEIKGQGYRAALAALMEALLPLGSGSDITHPLKSHHSALRAAQELLKGGKES